MKGTKVFLIINMVFFLLCFGAARSFSGEIEKSVKVKYFFPRDGKENPDGKKGIPNWFYYWTQITGKENLVYKSVSTINPRRMGYYDYNGEEGYLDKCIIFDLVVTNDHPYGLKGKAGIDCFGQTVLHERKHREQFHASGYPDTNGDGVPEWSAAMDRDRDWLSDSYEDKHGFDKNKVDTDGDGINDLEEEPIEVSKSWGNDKHNNQDWAKPGKNWKTP